MLRGEFDELIARGFSVQAVDDIRCACTQVSIAREARVRSLVHRAASCSVGWVFLCQAPLEHACFLATVHKGGPCNLADVMCGDAVGWVTGPSVCDAQDDDSAQAVTLAVVNP